VELVHFARLKTDLEGEMRRIARFLEIEISATAWPKILEHCSFDYMKSHADKSAPLGGILWEGGGGTFINKGVNGRWREVLSKEDVAAYEARSLEELGPECARWLATGELPA